MRNFYMLALTVALALALATPAASQSTDVVGRLSVHAQVGMTTDPGAFDVFRATTFDMGAQVGGGFTYVLFPNIAVRGDFTFAPNTGREDCCPATGNPGAVVEDVSFDRTYSSMSIQIRFPVGAAVPYVRAGVGFISLSRFGEDYEYDFVEFGTSLAAGLELRLGDSPVALFVDAAEWIYPRTSTGFGSQYDTQINVGLSYDLIR
jgi:hypothetical protein